VEHSPGFHSSPSPKEKYQELMEIQEITQDPDVNFLDLLNKYDSEDYNLESVTACTSAACIAKADADVISGRARTDEYYY
jgi:hypothetical protein